MICEANLVNALYYCKLVCQALGLNNLKQINVKNLF